MKNLSLKSWEEEFEKNYYMYIPLTIILLSCVGSIAAMKVLEQGVNLFSGLELTLIVAICMGYNGTLYAGLNKKLVFWWLIIGTLICVSLFVITLF